ncbi:MAG: beta strand repeat-containing protein [Chthoniobacterales bacterium]
MVLGLPAFAGTTWDGGGTDTSWGTKNNWSNNALPAFNGFDTITLGTGISAGAILTLDGTRYINDLVITTSTASTISAGTGGTLNLRSGNITRQNVSGIQTISAGVVLGDPTGAGAYTGTWNIAGTNSLDISGNITETGGSRSLNKTGGGTVILSGTNTFSGGLTLTAGIISISANSNLGAYSGGLIFNGGTLQITQNIVATRAITMTGAGTFDVSIGKTMEDSGVISGNGALSLTSFGTLILSGSGSNGTGSTNVSGILSLRGTVSLGTGNLAFNPGILELGNGNFTRALGGAANQVDMTNSSGFAAYGADRTVNLGGAGSTLTWGSGSFLTAANAAFFLGDQTADHTVDFQNGINLNGGTRSFQTLRGVGSVPEAKLSGVISGTGASNFSLDAVNGYAAGSVILSNGSNSYAGTTTINAGNLLLTANATATAGNTVLGSGSSDVLVGNITGAYDAGLLTNSAVSISRNVRAQSGNTGVITVGGNSSSISTFSGNVFLGTNSGTGKGVTLTAASGGTTTFSGVIQDPTAVSGAGLVRKSGAGTVVLSGVNTYAGGTAIDGGTLSVSQSSNLGANSGAVAVNAGTLEITNGFSTNRLFSVANSASTFQVDAGQIFTIASAVSGSGTLNKSGTGKLVLSGANTYTGATFIAGGVVDIQNALALGTTGSGTTVNSGAELDFEANVAVGAETVTLNGSGTAGNGALRNISGNNSLSGSISLGSSSMIGSDLGTLSLSGGISNGGFTLTFGGAGNTTESGTISGSGNLAKSGSGNLTLSGANSYTGTTTVSGGTLTVANGSGSALGTTASVLVNWGSTLLLGANNQINNTALLILAGGTFGKGAFSEGSGNTVGLGALTLTAAGSHIDFGTGTVGVLTFASFNPNGFTLTIDNWTGTANQAGSGLTDRLIFNSDQSANLSSFIFTGYGSGGAAVNLNNGFWEVTPVPEASTWVSAAFAFAAIGFHAFQQRRKANRSR